MSFEFVVAVVAVVAVVVVVVVVVGRFVVKEFEVVGLRSVVAIKKKTSVISNSCNFLFFNKHEMKFNKLK